MKFWNKKSERKITVFFYKYDKMSEHFFSKKYLLIIFNSQINFVLLQPEKFWA